MTLCYVMYTFSLHFSCYGMRSVMLQINEYDDDDDDDDDDEHKVIKHFCLACKVVEMALGTF